MCRNYIYWATEFLNYMSLVFWGLKLFERKYEIGINRGHHIQNYIFVAVSVPIAIICTINYKYLFYSNAFTYFLILYMYICLKIFERRRKIAFSMVTIYVNGMRLIDLWVVSVILEINRMSRYVEVDIIHMGIGRSVFMLLLSVCYYVLYRLLDKNTLFDYLYENIVYRWGICLYSLAGIMCFCTVYLFDYNRQMIQYWNFYLICAFIFGGISLFYLIQVKVKEKEKILNTRNDMMEANYQGLEKAYAENQMLNHDYKNHMLSVRQLIKEYL